MLRDYFNDFKYTKILDVGCGTGHHVNLLNKYGYKVYGIDKSDDMISIAKKNYPKCNFSSGDFLTSNFFDINTFTHILCLNRTFYEIDDLNNFFKECSSLLNINGYLIINIIDINNFNPYNDIYNPKIKDIKTPKNSLIDKKNVKKDNLLVGINSSGIHSNGFSLIRKIIKESTMKENDRNKITDLALKPTHLYPNLIMQLINQFKIHGMAHITGGGLTENIPRSLSKHLAVEIYLDSWELPEIFKWLQKEGNIDSHEMYRVLNCGVGMVVIISKESSSQAIDHLSACGENAWLIGEVVHSKGERVIIE